MKQTLNGIYLVKCPSRVVTIYQDRKEINIKINETCKMKFDDQVVDLGLGGEALLMKNDFNIVGLDETDELIIKEKQEYILINGIYQEFTKAGRNYEFYNSQLLAEENYLILDQYNSINITDTEIKKIVIFGSYEDLNNTFIISYKLDNDQISREYSGLTYKKEIKIPEEAKQIQVKVGSNKNDYYFKMIEVYK